MKQECVFIKVKSPCDTYNFVMKLLAIELGGHPKGRLCENPEEVLENGKTVFLWNLPNGSKMSFSGKGMYYNYAQNIIPYITTNPMAIYEQLEKLHQDTKVYVSDQAYASMIKNYLNLRVEYVPIPGTASTRGMSWQKRKNTVFFPGNYLNPDVTKKTIKEKHADTIQRMLWRIIDKMINDQDITVEQAVVEIFEDQTLKYNRQTLCAFLREYSEIIYEYINRYQKKRILKYLLKAGISVTVSGANWKIFEEELSEAEKECFYIIDEILPFSSVKDYMGTVKVVLNVSAGYRTSLHERVSSALLSGAVCFTECNNYTEQIAQSNDALMVYRYKNMKKLVREIKKQLDSNDGPTKGENGVFTIPEFANKINEMMSHINE